MYVIIGANGFLGSYLIKNILADLTDDILVVSRNCENISKNPRIRYWECDITDFNSAKNLKTVIGVHEKCKVIFLAAYHHPDLVASNSDLAWNVNITSLSFWLNAMEHVKCLFYPSTDTVYGNGSLNKPFQEDDELHPVNVYGQQKVLAEKIVTTYGYNVVRFPFLIGPSLLKHKKHFYDEIVEKLSSGIPIEMYQDSIRSSLDFDQAAKILLQLMECHYRDMPQIINLSSDEALSKYDIGMLLAEKLKVSSELVIPISSDGAFHIFKTPRAKIAVLDNTRLKNVLGLKKIKLKL